MADTTEFIKVISTWLEESPAVKNSPPYTNMVHKRAIPITISKEFWNHYRSNKNTFRDNNIYPIKDQNTWYIIKPLGKDGETKLYSVPQVEIKATPNDIHILSKSKLLQYQTEHAQYIIASIINNNAALDASDTGTGKTYTALCAAYELNLTPFIVCPISVIPSWKKALAHFNIDGNIINYEKLKTGNTPFLTKTTKNNTDKLTWELPSNTLIIFDEAHKCKNQQTKNSKMLLTAKDQKYKIMCLSATIADSPLKLYSVGKVLNLFKNKTEYRMWMLKRGVVYDAYNIPSFIGKDDDLKRINADIFPLRGHRMRIKELGDQFPDTVISAELYDMGTHSKQINDISKKIKVLMELVKKSKERGNILAEITKLRQAAELHKIDTIVELSENGLEEGNSIVIMLNFNDTVDTMLEHFDKHSIACSIIRGGQTPIERERNIELFQTNVTRVMICNIKSGGVGVSLHDTDGRYPRLCIISPSYSAQDIIQATGRVWRAGGKSKSIQKIVYCANTIEEEVCEKLSAKINNISQINDADINEVFDEFNSTFIDGEQSSTPTT